MANNDIQYLQGIDTVAYVRLLENAAKERGQLIPYQTSLDFDPQRDTDTTQTKQGGVPTTSSLETDLEIEFVHNISKVSDDLMTSLLKNKAIDEFIDTDSDLEKVFDEVNKAIAESNAVKVAAKNMKP